jgi:hypothetical protein
MHNEDALLRTLAQPHNVTDQEIGLIWHEAQKIWLSNPFMAYREAALRAIDELRNTMEA